MTGQFSHFSAPERIYLVSSARIMKFSFFQWAIIFCHSRVIFRNLNSSPLLTWQLQERDGRPVPGKVGLGTRRALVQASRIRTLLGKMKGILLPTLALCDSSMQVQSMPLLPLNFYSFNQVAILTQNHWEMGFLKIAQLFFNYVKCTGMYLYS